MTSLTVLETVDFKMDMENKVRDAKQILSELIASKQKPFKHFQKTFQCGTSLSTNSAVKILAPQLEGSSVCVQIFATAALGRTRSTNWS